MKTQSCLRTAIAAACFAIASAHAGIIYQQAPAQTVSTAWTSQFGIGQGGYQALDDFRVDRNATVQRITWQGTYFDIGSGQLAGGTPNTDTWTVEFWSGDATGPAQQLYSQDYRGSDASRTVLGTQGSGATAFAVYAYTLDLTLDFDVVADTQYWFSVMSKSQTFNPLFSWTNAEGGGTTFQRQFAGNGKVVRADLRDGNRAFTLETVEVPEPASLALAATALLAGGLATRRGRAPARA